MEKDIIQFFHGVQCWHAPIALLQKAGLIHDFPGHVLAALIAGLCVYFFFSSRRHSDRLLQHKKHVVGSDF
jgi:hypothetical protein